MLIAGSEGYRGWGRKQEDQLGKRDDSDVDEGCDSKSERKRFGET